MKISKSGWQLVWLDMEMTGLDPEIDTILEVATIITDPNMEETIEGPELVIHQSNEILERMDKWNQDQHGKSGLIERVQKSSCTIEEAEEKTLDFIRSHIKKKKGLLAGNSIWQDRRFIYKYMPKLNNFLHYRMVDVSSIKFLAENWYGLKPYEKAESHRAMSDVKESIAELKHLRKECFLPIKP